MPYHCTFDTRLLNYRICFVVVGIVVMVTYRLSERPLFFRPFFYAFLLPFHFISKWMKRHSQNRIAILMPNSLFIKAHWVCICVTKWPFLYHPYLVLKCARPSIRWRADTQKRSIIPCHFARQWSWWAWPSDYYHFWLLTSIRWLSLTRCLVRIMHSRVNHLISLAIISIHFKFVWFLVHLIELSVHQMNVIYDNLYIMVYVS